MRGLDPFRIEMDLAAVDGGRREAAGLEKSGVPEPLSRRWLSVFSSVVIGI
jgi:hypothetical protein